MILIGENMNIMSVKYGKAMKEKDAKTIQELAGWKILVGPREAAHIPKYLKQWKPE